MRTFILTVVAALSLSCHHDYHGQANEHMHHHSFDELVASFDNPARDTWQKPDEVMKRLGNVNGKKVFEIGSGTGYFTFRLEKAGASVICGDVDQRFLDLIEKRRKERSIPDGRIQLRKIPHDSPSLTASEVDVILTVNTYHHIENRIPYMKQVRAGMKSGGRFVIVDFKKGDDAPFGPPASMRISDEQITTELKQAGFARVETDSTTLPYQVIITAYR